MSRQAQDRGEGGGEVRFGGRVWVLLFFLFFFWVGCVGRGGEKRGGVGGEFDEWAPATILSKTGLCNRCWWAGNTTVSTRLTQKEGERKMCVCVCACVYVSLSQCYPSLEQCSSMWPQLRETLTIWFQKKNSQDAILFMLAHTRECTAGVAMTWITNELMGA